MCLRSAGGARGDVRGGAGEHIRDPYLPHPESQEWLAHRELD